MCMCTKKSGTNKHYGRKYTQTNTFELTTEHMSTYLSQHSNASMRLYINKNNKKNNRKDRAECRRIRSEAKRERHWLPVHDRITATYRIEMNVPLFHDSGFHHDEVVPIGSDSVVFRQRSSADLTSRSHQHRWFSGQCTHTLRSNIHTNICTYVRTYVHMRNASVKCIGVCLSVSCSLMQGTHAMSLSELILSDYVVPVTNVSPSLVVTALHCELFETDNLCFQPWNKWPTDSADAHAKWRLFERSTL